MSAAVRPSARLQFLSTRNAILVVVIALLAFLTLVPLFFLLWNSFKPAVAGQLADFSLRGFTLIHFLEAYSSPQTFLYLWNTLMFAAGTMIVALLLGGAIAFLVERTNVPFRNVIYGLMFIPLVLPAMLKAIAWVLLLSPRVGMLNQVWFAMGFEEPLFRANSLLAMSWVEGLAWTPLVFFLVGSAIRAMDPSLEEAALTSGASRANTLFRITLRLMTPALAAVALLIFVRGLESLDVPLIMGAGRGVTLYATEIYYAVRVRPVSNYGEAFVLSWVLMVLALAGLVLYQRVLSRSERYVTVTGKGYRPRLLDLGKWRPLAAGLVILLFFVSFALPFLVLLWVSFLPYLQLPTWEALSLVGLNNYRQLFARPDFGLMVRNSIVLSLSVSVGGMLLATLVSWIVLRLKPKGAKLLDTLAFLPYAIPAIAMGFSFMILFLYLRIGIYGTIWILVLAHLIRYLPMATRFTNTGVTQIHKELEEAAAVSGANLVSTMRRILIPLILPALLAGGLYLFILVNKVFSLAVMLYTPKSVVLPVYMYELWELGSTPLIGALSVLMVIIFTTLTIVSRKLAQRQAMVAEV